MAWKDIRIQGKFVIGFGSIIVLLIIMSVISIFYIQQLIGNAGAVIDGNKLKSNIIQKEVDHLNWEASLSAYLNDSSTEELTIQTDPTKCAFGQWYYGEGRKEAEALVPALVPLLKQIEASHSALHRSAVKIEQNHTTVDSSLGSFFREKKLDHINWKLNLLDYITDEAIRANPVQTDYRKCDLGLWLYSGNAEKLISSYPDLRAVLTEMMAYHEKMHDGAEVIENLVKDGKRNEALSYFHGELESYLEGTLKGLDSLIMWHDSQMESMNVSRTVFNTDTHTNLLQVQDIMGQMIDTVNSNIMTEDVMLSSGQRAASTLLLVSITIAIVAIAMAIILSSTIIRPILKCVTFADEISLGDLNTSLDINQKDQIGRLCDSLRQVLKGFREKADVLGRFAEGDLTAEVVTLSDKDGLGLSLQRMKSDLSDMISQIVAAVDQISSGAEQIAQASQNLSEGAATQASSTEEVSVMVNEISGQAAQNSDNASQAKSISEKASTDAEKGNRNMAEVVNLMEMINSGADKTKKIVKVIDDIAFQINLLALNANVEAARAGKYGKGFAVVADEVRNLAVKSAQAARETSDMVEESIRNIRNGSEAVKISAEQLEEIVKGARQVSEILEEIAAASKSQDTGISQATSGLDQIDKITQENTGNAEETASAAEELSSQSIQLKGLVERFRLENGDKPAAKAAVKRLGYRKPPVKETHGPAKPLPPRKESVHREERQSTGIKPVNPSEIISLDDNDFDQF